jgi:hypothetical protein
MLAQPSWNCTSLKPMPEQRRTRGMMFSGLRSSTGSASQPSWKSMRQMPSAACSSTLWPGWNGGSNQNQRSAGKSRRHLDVGDQEAVAEGAALGFLAQQLARLEREPSQAAT